MLAYVLQPPVDRLARHMPRALAVVLVTVWAADYVPRLRASQAQPPVAAPMLGARLLSVCEALPGVRDVCVREAAGAPYALRGGVVVVAASTWAAMRSRRWASL